MERGWTPVVVADPVIDLFNPNAIRASVSAVFQSNVVTDSAENTIAWLRQHGLATWATFPDATDNCWQVDYRQPGAIVVGSESQGLSSAWQADDIQRLSLPMLGGADSLNVSVTAAVLFYERVDSGR